jgi:beta-hydroxyacyl-ACP dehydratase FabZ
MLEVMSVYDINFIKEHLPHRYPFLLVDKIVEVINEPDNKQVIGIKNVTYNEPFFQGHFPEAPVMPGVLILEALGQVAGVLLNMQDEYKDSPRQIVYLATIERVKFRKPVRPGDQLRTHATLIQRRGNMGRFRFVGTVDGEVVAEAVMGFSIAPQIGAK